MKTQDLLACATPEATQYIQSTINSKNKADYQKLKKLFDSLHFEAKSFDDSELDILTFDWQSLERDRNWWWQLQALPFLNWYVNSLALQSEEERIRYFSLCVDAIHCWIKQAKQNNESPLVWHDHAAAFRVRNLTNWLVFCHSVGLPVSEVAGTEPLASLIIEHLDWLQEDKNYSKHTNHGFDQSMIALTIGLMFASSDFGPYLYRNRERLKSEVSFAFTDEGVHKENSPGYQKMMLSRLKQLRTLAPLGGQEISQMGERYIEKAEAFLRAVTLPNGYLPMIGDTRGGDEGLPYQQQEVVDVLDYSASGYVIIRGENNSGLDFFLLFKSVHESNYHRHDDDLMIYLYVNGETVLGDGGLGVHQETDPRRKHLRSVYSHSVPVISGNFIRDKNKLPALPELRLNKKKFIAQGVSKGFGFKVIRTVDYSKIASGILVVTDRCDKHNLASNWFIISNSACASSDKVTFNYPCFSMRINIPHNEPVEVIKGWNEAEFFKSSIMSESYNEYSPTLRFVVGGGRKVLKVELVIDKTELS